MGWFSRPPKSVFQGDGPMRVTLSTEEIRGPSYKHRAISQHWFRLHIKVEMSERDYELFKKAGLIDQAYFSHPWCDFPDTEEQYLGHHLFNSPYVDFPNMQALDIAKDELLRNLHAARSRIEQLHEARGKPSQESFEI
jgi:hypothetical protein